MEKLFIVEESKNIKITFDELLNSLMKSNEYVPCYVTSNTSSFFLNLIKGLVSNNDIILVDSDISNEEVEKLEIKPELFHSKRIKIECNSIIDIVERIKKSNSEITLFTSGTTGTPKRIVHSVQSLTRNTKIDERFTDNVWAYCYNPTHMAGIQVFFQAFFNQNTLIFLFSKKREEIFNGFEKYQISNISATPTFYRLLLPFEKEFHSIKRVTFGGEKTNEKLISNMKQFFPNAKFNNIYASTEVGSLLTSNGEFFSIPQPLAHRIRIIDNELQIHKNLLAKNFNDKDDWYLTGDIVQIVKDNPIEFKFNGRKSEIINTGGYKINPKEVEEVISQLPEVNYAKVYAKKNSVLGNIVCSEILFNENCSLTEEQIRTYLKSKLQEFKIPRFYKFIDKIEMTNTGKIK